MITPFPYGRFKARLREREKITKIQQHNGRVRLFDSANPTQNPHYLRLHNTQYRVDHHLQSNSPSQLFTSRVCCIPRNLRLHPLSASLLLFSCCFNDRGMFYLQQHWSVSLPRSYFSFSLSLSLSQLPLHSQNIKPMHSQSALAIEEK